MRTGRYSGTTLNKIHPLKKLSKGESGVKTGKKIKIEHPECKRTVQDKKVKLSKKTEKTYKVVVTYVQLPDDEARIKRAMLENILKQGYG